MAKRRQRRPPPKTNGFRRWGVWNDDYAHGCVVADSHLPSVAEAIEQAEQSGKAVANDVEFHHAPQCGVVAGGTLAAGAWMDSHRLAIHANHDGYGRRGEYLGKSYRIIGSDVIAQESVTWLRDLDLSLRHGGKPWANDTERRIVESAQAARYAVDSQTLAKLRSIWSASRYAVKRDYLGRSKAFHDGVRKRERQRQTALKESQDNAMRNALVAIFGRADVARLETLCKGNMQMVAALLKA